MSPHAGSSRAAMKEFGQLTARGRARRERTLAFQALELYGVPPERFTEIRLDRIGSFAAESQIDATDPHPLVSGERQALFRRESKRVQAELDRLYSRPDRPLFLHLDMHLGNVKLVGGRLAVLDF